MNDLSEVKERVRDAVDIADFVRSCDVKLTGGPVEFKGMCPFHLEKTASFTVNTDKRIFHCFGCAASGDVFEFAMRKKGLDFMSAFKLLANGAGIAIPERRLYQPGEVRAANEPANRGPFDPDQFRPLTAGSKVFEYLTGKRLLKPEFLAAYSVGETSLPEWVIEREGLPKNTPREAYAFAYKWRPVGWMPEKPKFEFAKCVALARPDGKKLEWRAPKGGKNILFGMFAVPDDCSELVISEGEIDAISWAQFGFPAVSVPNGAGALNWIDVSFDWLARFKKIHLSFDEDRAGRQKVVEVVQRLGIARTDIVRLPEKGEAP